MTNSSTNPSDETGRNYDGAATTAELPSLEGDPSTDPSQQLDDSGTAAEAAEQPVDEGPDSDSGLDGGGELPSEGAPLADEGDQIGAYEFDPDRSSPYGGDVTPPPRHLRSRRLRGTPTPQADGDETDGLASAPRRHYVLLASLALPVMLALNIVAWAVDNATSSGQVQRNVEIAGQPIGGTSEESLPGVITEIAEDVASPEVVIDIEGETHEINASSLGLMLDEQAMTTSALNAGRSNALVLRPLQWAFSFLSPRDVPLRYKVSETDTAAVLQLMQGEDRTMPVDPTVELVDGQFVVVPGQPGQDIDSAHVAAALVEAAEESPDPDSRITVDAPVTQVQPRFSDEEAQELADRANEITADSLTLEADGHQQAVTTEQLRSWMSVTVTDEGELALLFDTEAAEAALPELFSDLTADPQNATVTLEGGRPVVQPSQNGVTCCGEESGTQIWNALQAGEGTVGLEVETVAPDYSTEAVEAWGIAEPIGGSRAWRSGAGDVSGPGPGFTTFYTAGQNRASNIQLMARHVNGAVIPPGARFSINEHVGPRTAEKGYLSDGAIRDGKFVQEIGGGVSQFSTTMFNAAFFAGLDIVTYQAHTEYFDRYPPGREATMGHPAPDLVIENNTPYGMLIQTSSTDTSVTVTFWSTPHASAEQTNISEGRSGNCRVVTTTRTRTYPDGSSDSDTFRATYRPGEGQFC